ncbi:MAG: valine--tRNA ligase, partial [Chlamydiae bacterium]|nr:valine--tRNA ligase [Chlamydiota bacterium]
MKELDKVYDPKIVEKKWYDFWQEENLFSADANSNKPKYSIPIPPPNVTGSLHMGHGLVDTIQDILIRYKRMSGFEALWIPGTDHAGISTQTVVERHLYAKYGKRKRDYSREEFVSHIWDWKEIYQEKILHQLQQLGCSCDWSRLRFTMDEGSNLAVKTIFKKMFDDKIIYRGYYLVNWDPILQTAIADDEVEHEERESFLWHFSYPVDNEFITIATTRPETMLGDVAVAVHPEDPRYKHLIGKKALLPLQNRLIPIIADQYVDKDFGTGAVKITPAHDVNDYEIAKRHKLEMINIMNPDATINENGGKFQNLSREDAREAVVSEMKKLGMLVKIEKHQNRVGISYRTKAIIEPYLSKQWFIKMEPFKEKLMEVVRTKQVEILPSYWEKTYFHWIENLRDWCISRQLWWGHRIPVWYHKDDPEKMICHIGDEDLGDDYVQDEDVLDTWFSSALWPFSTLGWPNKTDDLASFFPHSTLVTGHDILFFWVARMIMMSEYAEKKVPFKKTFIHGLIYGKSYWREDKEKNIAYVSQEERKSFEMGNPVPKDVFSKWEKMSKSKGNVIDPLEIIDEYGADAMRLALCFSVTDARQIDLDRRRFEEFRSFANKFWNAARFVFLNLETVDLEKGLNRNIFTLDDKWILSRLEQVVQEIGTAIEDYNFDQVAKTAYNFLWDEFCAYYLEISKPYLFGKKGNAEIKNNKQVLLLTVFTSIVRLLHPVAPFITEEIFSCIKDSFHLNKILVNDPYLEEFKKAIEAKACIVAPYPTQIDPSMINSQVEDEFAFISEVVYAIRNIRAEMGVMPGVATELYIEGNALLIKENEAMISSLVKIEQIHFSAPTDNLFVSKANVRHVQLFIPLPAELIDKERQRLEKEMEKLFK